MRLVFPDPSVNVKIQHHTNRQISANMPKVYFWKLESNPEFERKTLFEITIEFYLQYVLLFYR